MSVDPYMRPYVSRLTTPFTMIGTGVYKIRESRDTEFPQGGTVVANIGWVKTAIVNSKEQKGLRLMPDQMLVGISPSKLLGALGMPGNTAYFGFLSTERGRDRCGQWCCWSSGLASWTNR